MSRGIASRLAWSLWTVCIACASLQVVLTALTPGSWQPDDLWFNAVFLALTCAFGTVGALVAARRPENAIGWMMCAAGVSFGVVVVTTAYAEYAIEAGPGSLPAVSLAAWVSAWAVLPGLVLTLTFLPMLFPDGRLQSPRWRIVAWVAASGGALALVGVAFKPGPVVEFLSVTNPVGVGGAIGDGLGIAEDLGGVLVVLACVASAASMVLRLRRSRGVERQQLKWFAYTAALALIGWAGAGLSQDWPSDVAFLFGLMAVTGIPISVGIAILRHRLYDIDHVINRTLVYGALTAILATAYLGAVLLFQLALSPLAEDSGLAIASSTLAVAALVRPARARIQAAVDRRFYRRRYDARRTLEAFAVQLRNEIDLDALGVDLRAVVRETMQPAHVSLWLRRSR
jgi:hypothetical protein